VKLKLQNDREDKETASSLVGLAGGCCFDFTDAGKEPTFVVGSEEGAIECYSNSYNSTLQRSYQGHHMATYTVCWNTFHPDVFLSCSADWTVKLWERNTSVPIMTFDLNTSVGDVAWAPFSSTVFATITTDGRVRIYDLSVNKHEPLGETKLSKKAKLTHISFNPREAIVCVGDDRGAVNILKLSSNLHKMSAPKLEDIEPAEEIAKLNKVMIMPEQSGADGLPRIVV
jgi:dynein intermediate chain 1